MRVMYASDVTALYNNLVQFWLSEAQQIVSFPFISLVNIISPAKIRFNAFNVDRIKSSIKNIPMSHIHINPYVSEIIFTT